MNGEGVSVLFADHFVDLVAQVAERLGHGRAEGTRGLLGPLPHLRVLGRRFERAENRICGLAQLLERAVELSGRFLVGRTAIVALQLAGQVFDIGLESVPCFLCLLVRHRQTSLRFWRPRYATIETWPLSPQACCSTGRWTAGPRSCSSIPA